MLVDSSRTGGMTRAIFCIAVGLCLLGAASVARADNYAYVTTSDGGFGTFDFTTETYTSIAASGTTILSAGLGEVGGALYGSTESSSTLYSVNTLTGKATVVGGSFSAYGGFGSTTSTLYAVANGLSGTPSNPNLVQTINPTTGAATSVGSAPSRSGVWGLSTGSDTLYYSLNGSLYDFNTSTKVFQKIGAMVITGSPGTPGTPTDGTDAQISALVYLNGTLYGTDNNEDVYTLNTTNGTATFLYNVSSELGGNNIDGLAPDNSPVPVPPSMLLFVPGLLGLVGMRKRFKK